ncbi:MAG: tetratricopeptide repeat protein, partial [Xanthomonadales bacterium]|nr:tetratricopeptide repeat protein [Xanthomonadales bacterium]
MASDQAAIARQLELALAAQQRGDLARAHSVYQQILQQQPQHVGARLHLAL